MMTTDTVTRDRNESSSVHPASPFSGALYRFHGFKVVDSNGERVGIVDWIWANELSGDGEYIGLQMQWLRGKARAVPATEAVVDVENSSVRLPFTKHELVGAVRCRIDRPLSEDQHAAICAHFSHSTVQVQSHSFSTQLAA